MKTVLALLVVASALTLSAATTTSRPVALRPIRGAAVLAGQPVAARNNQVEVPLLLPKNVNNYRLQEAGAVRDVPNAFRGTNAVVDLNKTYIFTEKEPTKAPGSAAQISSLLLKVTKSPTGTLQKRTAQLFIHPRIEPVPWDYKKMVYATKLAVGLDAPNKEDADAFCPLKVQLFAQSASAPANLTPATVELKQGNADGYIDVDLSSPKATSDLRITGRYLGTEHSSGPVLILELSWPLKIMPPWCWTVGLLALCIGGFLRFNIAWQKRKMTPKLLCWILAEAVTGAVLGVLLVYTGVAAALLPEWSFNPDGAIALLASTVTAYVGGSKVADKLWDKASSTGGNTKDPD